MLGQAHYYNRSIRKIVVAFGTLFNDLYLKRYNKAGTTSYEKFRVPLSYGSKERYLTAITSDPTLTKTIAVNIPRISFELTGMSYDNSRKQQSLIRNFAYNTTTNNLLAQYAPVPYDFNFSMSIYVRNTEDGTQIVEQILPFFKPDFTVTVDMIPDMNQKYDLPIILNSVNTTTDYEGALGDGTTRLIIWDLEFTVKGHLWPAVSEPAGLIGAYSANTGRYGQANTNIYLDTANRDAQKVFVDFANGNGVFTTSETIRVVSRGITGKVLYFSNSNTGILLVGELDKTLKANDVITGDYSNATFTISTVDLSPIKGVAIVTKVDPQTAGPDDKYGFNDEFTEWPDTLL